MISPPGNWTMAFQGSILVRTTSGAATEIILLNGTIILPVPTDVVQRRVSFFTAVVAFPIFTKLQSVERLVFDLIS